MAAVVTKSPPTMETWLWKCQGCWTSAGDYASRRKSKISAYILPPCSYPVSQKQFWKRKIRGLSSSNPLHLHAGTVALMMACIPISWHDSLWGWGQSRGPSATQGRPKRRQYNYQHVESVLWEEKDEKEKDASLEILSSCLKFHWNH